ncbi:WG repeat-containing protein [Niabella beijingensis]|uniref:WG repeat-containing protein n=1 Tax=Niabella beijingensis TaxID=2872700 RepID=UPI001CBE4852|nr:WG repeat-containing protein [Niabella beijingensis]MBZ4189712.1 WG repeat-containing protein [Niabella beijingensis]
MKKVLLYSCLLFALWMPLLACAQQKLYFFMDPKDSLIGVKDDKGRVIIPPKGAPIMYFEPDEPITDSLINLFDMDTTDTGTALSFGSTYNRKGKFLYRPLAYDNGPDYFEEGLARCVQKGKVGFVNEQGKIAIRPQWDWVSPFNYGYAFACNGCYWDRDKDAEHPPMAFKANAQTFYINREGKTVSLMKQRKTEKDLSVDGGYLPYPFRYTAGEQKILTEVSAMEVLSKIRNANYSEKREGKDALLQFEIVGRPSAISPYYKIQGYRYGSFNKEDPFLFYRSVKGEYFHAGWDGNDRTPFKQWLKEQLESCAAYFEKHPDAPNRFDVSKYQEQVKSPGPSR